MSAHNVPDSTDWLATPLSALAAVESALRCQLARKGNSQNTTSKRKATSDNHDSGNSPDSKRLRSSSRLQSTRSSTRQTQQIEYEETIEVADSDGDDDDDDEYEPEPDDGLVACPVCQDRMKDWQVFSHLERCTGPKPKPQRTVSGVSSSTYSQQRKPTKAPDRLPTINYAMFRDQALRKKMADLGIPNQGPRTLLERRHKEWMTIWNSNCDATRPRTRQELLRDLDIWEKTLGGRAPTTGQSIQNAAMIRDKDFDGAAWAAKHDASFQDLIANAQKTRRQAKEKAERAARETEMENTANAHSQAQELALSQLQIGRELPNSRRRPPGDGHQ
ncbi:hypothetical protein FPOAC1_006715 [Fusarium poae]|uniref:hypothetical protein n=1 Tax=Fusarium poae TaxID=36050 RepID=UPI001CEB061B|nr:hypothetical protein FPOAC1_006715 [Fusarium poae]KAG8673403.1 hypothetical protein FPOAC1_006715 [Fusarium poae]